VAQSGLGTDFPLFMTTQPVNLDGTTADLLDNCQTTKLLDDPTSQLSSHQSIDSPNHQNPQPPQPSTLTTHTLPHPPSLTVAQPSTLLPATPFEKKEQLHHSPSQNTGPPPMLLHSDIASNHPQSTSPSLFLLISARSICTQARNQKCRESKCTSTLTLRQFL